jgi:serine/threonine-protein kinase
MIGERLGCWTLDREIGRGGMACVYHARADPQPADGPAVAAVKVLAPELAAEPGFVARFEREVEILRKLDHPGIVRFYESGVHDGRPYFVMEYVDGPSYDVLLDQRGKLPWRDVLDLAAQVAPALKHAHDRGVIHRDLKPSNLLRAADPANPNGRGAVKVTDFGIASLFASRHLTVTGGVVGTAEYLSPEQAVGKRVTPRSDLYSLGAVLYTLITGRTPFEGEVVDLLHKHRFAQFERPQRLVPDLPPDFDAVICDLLEKDPARRPPDAAVLQRRLDSLRRKLARKEATPAPAAGGAAATADPDDEAASRPGPATLMSRLMRRELERQKSGGPWKRFLNRPWVLLALFVLTVAAIAWAFWPMSDEALYQRGAALMASQDSDKWDEAWDKYLGPLRERNPGFHPDELDAFRKKIDDRDAAKAAARATKGAGPMSEAQYFFQEGLRLRQQGKEDDARRKWRDLEEAFKGTPSEAPWVKLAQDELGKKDDAERQWGPVREAVKQNRRLPAEEKRAAMDALRRLYKDDAEAQRKLDEWEQEKE